MAPTVVHSGVRWRFRRGVGPAPVESALLFVRPRRDRTADVRALTMVRKPGLP
jgi:hypothetical protein